MTEAVWDRFWSKVDRRHEECWIWTGSLDRLGYGTFWFRGASERAHRVAYELARGVAPGPRHVRHDCDNRACVNPSHLRLGTHAENMRDKSERGRVVTYRGSRNPSAKLTEEQVKEIRRLVAGGATLTSVGHQFGTHRSNVRRIVNREKWAGVA